MMGVAADDAVRADVERFLHGVVDTALAAPAAAAGRVRRCVGHGLARAGDRLVAPVQIVRSVVGLAAGAGVGQAPDGRGPSAHRAEPAPPTVAAVPTPAGSTTSEQARAPVDGLAEQLPLEEYESLAASHVVARLDRLTAPELRRIQAFETANRGRRTVLGKIEQLLGSA